MPLPPDPRATTDDVSQRDSSPQAGLPAVEESAGAHLELLEEIARGGMGAILRGRDAEIGRDVAVKVLLEDHRGRPELARRFLEEARIAGRLQHPGVVPVYALGRLPDGRPYFTMKLIRGCTLAALLAERKDSSADGPRFLGVFEQVCQTLAYAHSKGVIHRDLKPSNVMVGAYGEVQVMDWGLAKVLPQDGTPAGVAAEATQDAASLIRTPRGDSDAAGDGDETREGTALGTPAYMSPEQARGEVEDVGVRSDVFGLGAILCEILTGRPPFAGAGEAALKRARRADLADALARLDGFGADAELVSLAKHCLAAEPAGRPRDAGAVAEAVTAHLASVQERLRQAQLARAAEHARADAARAKAAAERRARWLTAGLAGAVVLLAVGGGGAGLWWRQQQLERAAEQGRTDAARAGAVAADLQQAAEQRRRGRLAEAAAALERADGRLAGADAPEQRRLVEEERATLGRVRDEFVLADRLDEVRVAQAAFTGGHFDTASADAGYRDAFARHGMDLERMDAAEAAKRIRATAVADRLTAALDDWVAVQRAVGAAGAEQLRAVVERADDDPWRRRLRAALDGRDRAALEALAAEPQVAALQPADLVQLGGGLERLGSWAAAAAVLAEGRRRYPNDFWLNHQLGRVLLQMGRADDAARYYTAAIALHGDSPGAHINLGVAFLAGGRYDDALDEFRRVLARDGANALARYNVAVTLQQQGRLDEAEAEYRAVYALTPPMAEAHNNLAVLLDGRGRADEAVAEYRAALAIDADLPQSLCGLGRILQRQGRLTQGLALLRRGHEQQTRSPVWAFPSEQYLRDGERLVLLDAELPAMLRGEAAPSDPEVAASAAELCRRPFKRLYAASARFYAEAFAAAPDLAADPRQGRRYGGACAAATAGVGRGEDAPSSAEERARLRRQALAWLRADLDAWDVGREAGGPPIGDLCRQTLGRWTADLDLSGVRDADALDLLPAAERAEWRKLWADVQALLDKADAKK